QVRLPIVVTAPQYPTNYTLYLDLYKENEFAFADKGIAPDDTPTGVSVDFKAGYQWSAPALTAGQTATIPVTITNLGRGIFPVTNSFPVNLGYHWLSASGQTVVWDGARTKLGADLGPQQSVSVNAQVTAPPTGGTYQLRWDLVQEGVSWFSGKGVATLDQTVSVTPNVPLFYGGSIDASGTPAAMGTGMTVSVPLKVQNLSNFDFDSSINLSYHWYDASGASVVWD